MNSSEIEQREEVRFDIVRQEGTEVALLEFQGELRRQVLDQLRINYLQRGSYLPGARAISSQGIMSLGIAGGAAGATALSAATSSSLFMATANPATLMSLGNGVGSAVMGAGGIVAHAPFIAVASSLPVVAPILAIQALSAAATMQQFKQVERKLDLVQGTLNSILRRIEAEKTATLLATSHMIDELYAQYEQEGSFSRDMLIRLALAERDARALAIENTSLFDSRDPLRMTEADVDAANYEASSAMLASFVELRVAYLRVCVDVQENPRSVNTSTGRLKAVLENASDLWERINKRPDDLQQEIDRLAAVIEGKGRFQSVTDRNVSRAKEERDSLVAVRSALVDNERKLNKDYWELASSAAALKKALDEPLTASESTVVFWQDEAGDHALVTEQSLVVAAR